MISSCRKRCSGWKWPLSLSIHQPCLYPLSLPAGGTYRLSLPIGPSALISVSGRQEPVSGVASPLPPVPDQLLGPVFTAPPSRHSMEKSSVPGRGSGQHSSWGLETLDDGGQRGKESNFTLLCAALRKRKPCLRFDVGTK